MTMIDLAAERRAAWQAMREAERARSGLCDPSLYYSLSDVDLECVRATAERALRARRRGYAALFRAWCDEHTIPRDEHAAAVFLRSVGRERSRAAREIREAWGIAIDLRALHKKQRPDPGGSSR